MKQTFLILLVAVTAFSSCKKTPKSLTLNGGSWSIKGTTYNADSCVATIAAPYAELTAQTPINSNTISTYSQIVIGFGTAPVGTSTYIPIPDSVANLGYDSNQVFFYVNIGGLTNFNSYQSTASGTVAVAVSSIGKITASATNILVQNANPPYDTTRLTFNITQTN